jgi:VWFA-related protein
VDRDRIPQGGGRSFLDAAARFVDTLGPQDRVGLWTLPFAARVDDREHLKRELLKATGTMLPVAREQSERKGIMWDQSTPPTRRLVTPAGATLNESLHPLERMVASLAPLEGTKHLVLITGGTSIPEGDMMSVTRLSQMAAAARVHIHSLQVWNVLSGIRSDGDSLPQSAPPDQGSTAEAHLSWVTGGITVTSAQGAAGFARLGQELSAWYVVGIEPDAADRDGKSHTLEVKVEGRPGVIVRARQQFRLARQ